MIAPACYPVNGAEAIVNMKLLQAFSHTDDITVDLISRNNAYTYPSDGIEKYGVKINELHLIEYVPHINIPTLWRLILSLLYFRLSYFDAVWAIEALRVVKDLVRRNKYDFVLTKNAPSYLLGAYLKRKGLKWVASWNDPFPASYYPFPYGQGKDCKGTRLERRMIKQMRLADCHVFPTYLLQEHMRSYLQVPQAKCKVIPHVVLSNKGQESSRSLVKKHDVLKIIHSGNLYGQRNPSSFFNAVEIVLESNPNIKVSITILGKIDDRFMPELDNLPRVKQSLKYLSPVEYQQSLAMLDDYDLACVIEAPCRKGEAVFLPTKVTDFMQKGIPIMAISPLDGVLHGLYKNGNIGYYGDISDVSSIERTIKSAYKDYVGSGIRENVIDDSFNSESVVESYRLIAKSLNK